MAVLCHLIDILVSPDPRQHIDFVAELHNLAEFEPWPPFEERAAQSDSPVARSRLEKAQRVRVAYAL